MWSILGAVEQMDLSDFYGAYRVLDGLLSGATRSGPVRVLANWQGYFRESAGPGWVLAGDAGHFKDPTPAQGISDALRQAERNRSSPGIERECREDVVYKVITAMRMPDHSTIAEFRCRHERALAELFTSVLALCGEAGLVEVGVISIDGTKILANASRGANRIYERLVADILEEAEETDRWEDGLFGADRGDELPEHLRTEDGRRAAFEAAKERLAQKPSRDEEPEGAPIGLDPEWVTTRGWGRRAWHREGRKALLRQREQAGEPMAGSRPQRLLEAVRRLEENHQVEIQATEAYEALRAGRIAGGVSGNRVGGPPKPFTPPAVPEGVMNKPITIRG